MPHSFDLWGISLQPIECKGFNLKVSMCGKVWGISALPNARKAARIIAGSFLEKFGSRPEDARDWECLLIEKSSLAPASETKLSPAERTQPMQRVLIVTLLLALSLPLYLAETAR